MIKHRDDQALAVRSLQELGARIPRAALSPSPDAASLPVRAE